MKNAGSLSRLPHRRRFLFYAAIALTLVASGPVAAQALITGGEGNEPIRDPGWPRGAAAVFNTPSRVAWWEGPPFGGGQWHAECRGNAEALNEVLLDFAKIDAAEKRIVLHDGSGHSFWLNPNREEPKQADARIDWVFVIWQPDSWARLQQLPADMRPRDEQGAQHPVPQIDVYPGGNVQWSEVYVPAGITVVDQRLESHGFSPQDGIVLEGTVTDLQTGAPLAATMMLERVEPQPTGGYQYVNVAEVRADAAGRWVLKQAPAGWHRIVLVANGYAARVIGYDQFDAKPRWRAFNSGLSRSTSVTGRVVGDKDQPLADVTVRLNDVVTEADGSYKSPTDYSATTDANGIFTIEQVPAGEARVWISKEDYVRPGLGPTIQTPATDVLLSMTRAARLSVQVKFPAARPDGYIVNVVPAEGEAVGRWSGSSNLDANGFVTFKHIPPGKYVVTGRPNPGREAQQTAPVPVDLKGGVEKEVVLEAK